MAKPAQATKLEQVPSDFQVVESVRFHSSVQFEGGLGAKSRLTKGEMGCTLQFKPEWNAIIVHLPKHKPQVITTGIMVFTLA